jgi:hypothetical protein
MWCNKSTVGRFEKLPRSDRMLLLYVLDYNTKPRDWNDYLRPLRGTVIWRLFARRRINLDPETGRRANIDT